MRTEQEIKDQIIRLENKKTKLIHIDSRAVIELSEVQRALEWVLECEHDWWFIPNDSINSENYNIKECKKCGKKQVIKWQDVE